MFDMAQEPASASGPALCQCSQFVYGPVLGTEERTNKNNFSSQTGRSR